jgi:hypothetical protein
MVMPGPDSAAVAVAEVRLFAWRDADARRVRLVLADGTVIAATLHLSGGRPVHLSYDARCLERAPLDDPAAREALTHAALAWLAANTGRTV